MHREGILIDKISCNKFEKPNTETQSNHKILAGLLVLAFILLFSTLAIAAPVTYTYDDAGRLIREDGNGTAVEYIYDEVGNLLQRQVSVSSVTYISGTVTSGGVPLSGVTLTLSGSSSGTATTFGSGAYSFSGLGNGSYTITPSKTGYTFTPANLAVTISGSNVTGQDFAGVTMSVRIAGAVPVYYSTLQDAYDVAGDGAIIQSRATDFTENLTMNRPITVYVEGGYDAAYATHIGNTVLHGALSVSNGAVTMKNFFNDY